MNPHLPPDFDAVIFDLDGVITKTAATHRKAWTKIFNEYLQEKAGEKKDTFKKFTLRDYLKYVDGKPRYKGVDSFLKSRHINLPWGTPEDDPSAETVCGLGNRKNKAFLEILHHEGAEVYPSTKNILLELNQKGVKMGVASSSKNCRAVLETVGLHSLFKSMVDGVVAARLNLHGKPEPDIFIKSCEMLNANPEQSIVVEDAVSGVRAGANGNFGFILGIARKDNAELLLQNGADFVISDFEDINGADELNDLFLRFRKK